MNEREFWSELVVLIMTCFAVSCLTFLIGKSCDYDHAETMKRIECPEQKVVGK